MRRGIIITSHILSALIILDSLNIGHALLMFLVAGHVPLTSIYIDATTMIWVYTGAIGFIIGRLTSRALLLLQEQELTRQAA